MLLHDLPRAAMLALESCHVQPASGGALAVHSPVNGELLTALARDTHTSANETIKRAHAAQTEWAQLSFDARAAMMQALADAILAKLEPLTWLIALEAGKTLKEAETEAKSVAITITDTIARGRILHTLSGRAPLGLTGLITSFNFPLAVAGWTIAPALLAGNGVVWKPSEKTPLSALAFQGIFRDVAKKQTLSPDLCAVVVGERDIGEHLVAHPQIDKISATGSVTMGHAIRATLATKPDHPVSPILELGGNNAIIISHHLDEDAFAKTLDAVMLSALGTTGQRCTDTRRLIVARSMAERVSAALTERYHAFIASGAIASPLHADANAYGYGPLIDHDAFARYTHALTRAVEEGGALLTTTTKDCRLLENDYPNACYVKPALVKMPRQTEGGIMFEETFAPVLYITTYDTLEEAIALANAPSNAGLVHALYTQSREEADLFASTNKAGHSVINSPSGTNTPAQQMGFGGNRDSGIGVILAPDPFVAFTTGETPTPPPYPDDGKERWVVTHEDGSHSRVVRHPLFAMEP